jgi:hypothetical protein
MGLEEYPLYEESILGWSNFILEEDIFVQVQLLTTTTFSRLQVVLSRKFTLFHAKLDLISYTYFCAEQHQHQ